MKIMEGVLYERHVKGLILRQVRKNQV
jgi:hypothetical protein